MITSTETTETKTTTDNAAPVEPVVMCEKCDELRAAFNDLKKLAMQAMIESRVDMSIDCYTGEKLKRFVIAAHRTPDFHAECMKHEGTQ